MKGGGKGPKGVLQPTCNEKKNKESKYGGGEKESGVGPNDAANVIPSLTKGIDGELVGGLADCGNERIEIFKIRKVCDGFFGICDFGLSHELNGEACRLRETRDFGFE